jgi:hypothetical protein
MSWQFFRTTNRDPRPTSKSAQSRERKSTRLGLETLEDRCLLSAGLALAPAPSASPTFLKIGSIVAQQSSAIAIHSFAVVQQPGSPPSDRPTESLSFTYTEISFHYTPMNANNAGSAGSAGSQIAKPK